MHLVEQLRIKRIEAHNHLHSRKRKLAELYTATACVGGYPSPPNSQQYLLQLQAFQDANDLQKGRRFDESTLPARPQTVSQPRHRSPQIIIPETSKPAQNLAQSHDCTNKDVTTKSATRLDGADSLRKSPLPGPDRQNLDKQGPNGILKAKAQEDEKLLESRTEGSSTSGLISGDAVVPARSSRPSLQGIDVISGDNEQTHARPSLPTTAATVAAAVTVNGIDAQSSPTSTLGPSSNTPVPDIASPTTSLGGDEATTGSAILDADKSVGDSEVEARMQTPEAPIISHAHKLSVSSVDVDTMDIDPSTAFDSPVQVSKPQTNAQRESTPRFKPPIRINTQQDPASVIRPQPMVQSTITETPAPLTAATSLSFKVPSMTPLSAVDSSKRATRISSGALQKKSVSEILSGTPRSSTSQNNSPISASPRDGFLSATSQSRQADRERKERSKLSTVVFAKPQRPAVEAFSIEGSGTSGLEVEKSKLEDRDYLYTLFESKAYASKNGNLTHLIQHAHKAITTDDYLVDYEYQAQCRVLKRLYQLQSADRWALRQRKRADEPVRQTTHWDFLLDHVKWMRTDFREERKWKHAAAYALAESCAEWVASTPQEREQLQVRVRQPKARLNPPEEMDIDMEDHGVASHPTPDLLPSGEDESVSDDIADPREINLAVAPAAIFSLGASEFNFMADRTPAFDKLINELPLYQPARIEPDLAKSNLAERLDARWKTDVVAVSRFATEPVKVREHRPPFKRSRYEYDLEASPPRKSELLPPRDTNVALFMPENKHIRDRIHPGHSFRPPSEHPMPTQFFFESRASSHWTPTEDDELRRLVKDYSYNWSLISSCLTSKSLYSSSADRRTPWECFERWIGLEGMPTDMAKTPYFRTYSGRIEAASRHLQAQIEEAQRRAGTNAPIAARKRTNQPVRVDRKRAQRHLAMLDAMRKLAKKRETLRQKQQASAEMAAMRKTSEINNQQRPPLKKPSEWSAHKFEEDQKAAKRQEIYRQQILAHQRAATAQQRGPNGPVNGVPNGIPQVTGQARMPNGLPNPMTHGHMAAPNGVNRPNSGMLGVPNGMPLGAGMSGPKGMQAQLQANIRAGVAASPQQQMRMQEQLLRQAQQNGNHAQMNGMLSNGAGTDYGAVGNGATANGQRSPSGNPPGGAGSPRQPGVGQALSSGHVPVLAQIAANIKRNHPDMADEAIQRAASQQLTNWQQQATAAAAGHPAPRPRINQAALNAALGAANAAAAAAANGGYPPGQGMMTSEQLQQYRQGIRIQQAQQHAARGMPGQMPQAMMSQMTQSPVTNMARPVSQHANQPNMSRSATPRDANVGGAINVNTAASPSTNGAITTPGAASVASLGGTTQASPPRPGSQQKMQT